MEPSAEAPEVEEWKAQAEAFKLAGNESFKKGEWEEAVEWYTKAIDLDPDDRVFYSNRSAAYLKIGDAKSKALKDAEKCMELGKTWPKAYSRLGAAQHALRRFEAAVETFKAGLLLEPGNKGLIDGIAAAELGIESERAARWETARIEREAMEAARERQRVAAEAHKKAGNGSFNPGDPLNSFLSDIKGEAAMPVMHKLEKVTNDKYTAQQLGTAEQQITRLLSTNYKWKNLNPFEVLMLDVDATEEDIKGRYRKLSTLVHPDKCLDMPNAREAFEEVKKAYQTLMDESRRKLLAATVEAVRKRVTKERTRLLKTGTTEAALEALHGNPEVHAKKAIMKEFAATEMRRREIDKHAQAQKKREREQEDVEQEKLKALHKRETEWNEEDGREKRVGSWRDFAGAGKVPKKNKMWKEEERPPPPGGVPKFQAPTGNDYKKDWK